MQTATHTTNFQQAKVGDIVDLYNPLVARYTGESFNITRLTARQVIITRNGHEVRYRRFDEGIEIGMGWMACRIHLRLNQSRDLSPEALADYRRQAGTRVDC